MEGWTCDARPDQLGGASVADVLLEPTTIYVRSVLELLGSEIPVTASRTSRAAAC